MTFTNDDLKQLKQLREKVGPSIDLAYKEALVNLRTYEAMDDYNSFLLNHIEALLTRLEAAEAYIKAKTKAPYKGAEAYEVWRKTVEK